MSARKHGPGLAPTMGWLAVLLASMLLLGCAAPARDSADWQPLTAGTVEPTEAQRRALLRLELAAGFLQNGQPQVALEEVNRALVADPNLAAAHNLRGLVLMQLGEMALAEQSLQQALRLAPRDGDNWHNLGWLQCEQRRFTEAEQAFAQALQAPAYATPARTWMVRGLCQLRAEQPQQAIRSLTRAFELDPTDPVTLYNLAALQHQQGRSERARFYLRRLNQSEFANAESLWLAIRVENRLQNREAAQQLARQLQRRFPNSRQANAYERGAFDE